MQSVNTYPRGSDLTNKVHSSQLDHLQTMTFRGAETDVARLGLMDSWKVWRER